MPNRGCDDNTYLRDVVCTNNNRTYVTLGDNETETDCGARIQEKYGKSLVGKDTPLLPATSYEVWVQYVHADAKGGGAEALA